MGLTEAYLKHFVLVILGAILFGSLAHAGIGGEYLAASYNGDAISGKDRSNSLMVITDLPSNQIRLVFPGAFWSPDTRNETVYMNCSGSFCERSEGGGWARITLTVRSNGDVIISSKSEMYVFNRISGGGGGSSDAGKPWVVKDTVDGAGQRKVVAFKKDENSGATLVLSCDPVTTKTSWSINLAEKTYLAAQGAVIVAKGSLRTDGKLNSVDYQNERWELSANNYIVNSDATSNSFLSDLKKASNFQLKLTAVKTDGSKVLLESMNFALNGSTKAINDLQARCSGNTSDLPVPLP